MRRILTNAVHASAGSGDPRLTEAWFSARIEEMRLLKEGKTQEDRAWGEAQISALTERREIQSRIERMPIMMTRLVADWRQATRDRRAAPAR